MGRPPFITVDSPSSPSTSEAGTSRAASSTAEENEGEADPKTTRMMPMGMTGAGDIVEEASVLTPSSLLSLAMAVAVPMSPAANTTHEEE